MSSTEHPLREKTQDAVVAALRANPTGYAVLAETAKNNLSLWFTKAIAPAPGDTPQSVVTEVCHGAMAGVVLVEGDISQAGVALLGGMAEVAQNHHLEATDVLTWSLGGIARIAPAVPPAKIESLRNAIDAAYMGTGQLFGDLVRKVSA